MAPFRFVKVVAPSEYPVYHTVPLLIPACAAAIAAGVRGPAVSSQAGTDLPGWAGMRVPVWVLAVSCALILLAVGRSWVRARTFGGRGVSRRYAVLALGVACAICLGSCRAAYWQRCMKAAETLARKGKCEVTLIVCSDPRTMAGGECSFTARVMRLGLATGETADLRLLQYVSASVESPAGGLSPGDVIEVRGRISVPRSAMNPGEFDYRRYLATRRVFAAFEGVVTSRPENASGASLARLMSAVGGRIRERVRTSLSRVLPGEEASVMQGILLGDTSALSEEDSVNLDRAGVGRFLSVTGFHVTMAAEATWYFLEKLTRRYKLSRIASAVVALGTAACAGWTAGAIRASISSVMKALAPLARRRYNPIAGLSAALLVCAWAIPFPLTDVGFRLTFAASVGAFFGNRYKATDRAKAGIRAKQAAPALLGLTLFALPFMALDFPEVSLAGLVLGGLWAALISLLVPLAAVTAALPGLMTYLGWFPYWLGRGLRIVSAHLAGFPLASLSIPAPSSAMLLCWYVALGLLAWILEDRARSRVGLSGSSGTIRAGRKLMLAVVSASLLFSAYVRARAPWPQAVFLGVGQGDCAILRYKGSVLMVDTGTESAFLRSVLPYLRWAGIRKVDLCVLSHLHDDHAGGVELLCQSVPVSAILTCPGTSAELGDLLVPKERLADQPSDLSSSSGSSIPQTGQKPPPSIVEAVPGATYTVGEWRVRIEFSGDRFALSASDANEDCIIVSVSPGSNTIAAGSTGPGQTTFEFWGDAPSRLVSSTLKEMERHGVRIVKAPHHGSVHSLVSGLYEGLKAGAVLVSVGPNSYGHPSAEVLDCAVSQGLPVWRTDKSGAVSMSVKKGKVYVETYIESTVMGVGQVGPVGVELDLNETGD